MPHNRSIVDGQLPSNTTAAGCFPRWRRITPKTTESSDDTREEVQKKNNMKLLQKENINHDEELKAGSRVLVLCNEGKKWKATIKKFHVKNNGERGLKIHYDGMKKTVEYWVPVDRVVALLDKSGRPRKGRRLQPRKKRQPPTEQHSKAITSYPLETIPPKKPSFHKMKNAKEPTGFRSDHVGDNTCKLSFRVSYFYDDFDLFDGELLRTAACDEALKDHRGLDEPKQHF
ncbi:hypothetical protein ACHAWF_014502 [Thalassiosira exigua]